MKTLRIQVISLLVLIFTTGVSGLNAQVIPETINIGSRLELFVENFLIQDLDGAVLRLHNPTLAGVAFRFEKPWEGAFCGYPTVIKDGDTYLMYYRGYPGMREDSTKIYTTCIARSNDGIHWKKPELGIYKVHGTLKNNIILADCDPFTHNFSPFIDTKPGIPADERYKALAGIESSKLVAFVSPDGIHWKKMREDPVITDGMFDSQNVAFWSKSENCYVSYFRTWTGEGYNGYRTISRATSNDFINWSETIEMDYGDTPREHLYTNQTTPYFRAPHIYIALPMRFFYGRKVLTDAQAKELGVHANYSSDCAETVLMTSRGGTKYDRTFMEALIRPGTDLGNWASRAGLTALGVVPTGPGEISVYKQARYAQDSAHLLRYTLRTDGFTSVNAPYKGGEMVTKPLKFNGSRLVINFASSAAGYIKVEIQDTFGNPVEGFGLESADEIIGDDIERIVTWKGNKDITQFAGKAVQLRFVMKDADLYSIQFTEK